MLVLNMSPDRPLGGSSFNPKVSLCVLGRIEGAGRPSYFKEVATLWARSGSIFKYTDGWSRTLFKNEYARFYA